MFSFLCFHKQFSTLKRKAIPFKMDLHNLPGNYNCKRITDYDYFMNAKSKKRTPSALRELLQKFCEMPPHTIGFFSGSPNSNTFPFEELSVKLKDGSTFKIEGETLESALQYLPTAGYAPLVNQLKELQELTHGPQDWTRSTLLVTCGSTEPMAKVIELVVSEGDPVLVPIPLYVGTADMMRPYGLEFIELDQDKDGVQPQQLRQILEDRVLQKKSIPKLMYINPVACNPTGRNVTFERKKEIYKIACDYNFLLLEDDPYYPLQFLEENIPSLLSLDVEGRVIRLDSFSKILSSGLRLGFVTGPIELLRKIELHMQVTTLHTSGVSQVLISKLLEHWGHEEYVEHVNRVKQFYWERRDLMIATCDRYLKGVAEWDVSSGGMFLWVRVPVLKDTWELATKLCLERFLLIVSGHPFTGDLRASHNNYIRLSYSVATPEQIEKGVRLLSEIIEEVKGSKFHKA